MKDQLRGCIRITAKGKNLYRFINMIHCGRIMCFEQFCRNDTFFAEIYRHDLAKVMPIAEECGIELEHRELPTLSSKLLKYRRRIGLLIGAVFAVFIIAYFSNVVVTIEIQGNNTVCDEDILAVLDELGIRSGAHIRDLDLRYCENELRVRVKGVSWAAIRRTGNRIVVDVTEVVPAPEAPKRNVPCYSPRRIPDAQDRRSCKEGESACKRSYLYKVEGELSASRYGRDNRKIR